MEKKKRNNLSHIWQMRHLTVNDFLFVISKDRDLKFLITVTGAFWIMSTVVALTLCANVIYYLCRIFRLILG